MMWCDYSNIHLDILPQICGTFHLKFVGPFYLKFVGPFYLKFVGLFYLKFVAHFTSNLWDHFTSNLWDILPQICGTDEKVWAVAFCPLEGAGERVDNSSVTVFAWHLRGPANFSKEQQKTNKNCQLNHRVPPPYVILYLNLYGHLVNGHLTCHQS